MPRHFIQLSFKGTNYHGWQIQPNAVTVQSELNKALSTILKEEIHTTGAGRTDSGVHASCFVAHFDSMKYDDGDSEKLVFKLNKFLSQDIKVHRIIKVDDNLHSRFSAISRTYHYLISRKKTVFNNDLSCFIHGKIDIESMNKAAHLLASYSDFTSFSRLHGETETNICKIIESNWVLKDHYLLYKVTANRFLRNMVRAMVGTMLNVGTKKLSIQNFIEIIESKNRTKAGSSAKAKGLFLTSIEYPRECGLVNPGMEFPDFLMV